jgi:hypothetical protein
MIWLHYDASDISCEDTERGCFQNRRNISLCKCSTEYVNRIIDHSWNHSVRSVAEIRTSLQAISLGVSRIMCFFPVALRLVYCALIWLTQAPKECSYCCCSLISTYHSPRVCNSMFYKRYNFVHHADGLCSFVHNGLQLHVLYKAETRTRFLHKCPFTGEKFVGT